MNSEGNRKQLSQFEFVKNKTVSTDKLINYFWLLAYFIIGSWYLFVSYDVVLISGVSLLYSFYLIKRLFDSLGQNLPFKELILSLMGIQMLLSPFLEYYYFQNEVFGVMRVDEETYYSYVLPATLALHFGLNLCYPRQTNEKFFLSFLSTKKKGYTSIGLGLIIFGYLFYLLSPFVPAIVGFAILPFTFMRFIGFFYLWFAESRYTKIAFPLVFIPFLIATIRVTIFIDLIVISIFLTSAYLIKNKMSKWKIVLLAILGFGCLFLLQSVKHSYRQIVWSENYSGNSAILLANTLSDQIANWNKIDMKAATGGFNLRLNQGWILTHIMDNMPERTPFANGEYLKRELVGLLLPRFIYPEKPVAGDRKKFSAFLGWSLGSGVTMNVGLMGDGYGNYGREGGVIFCFVFGLALGYIFKLFYKLSHKIPTLPIWGILIFFYSMRAGNEFYIIANWIIKTGVVVWLYYLLVENKNRIELYLRRPLPKEASSLYSSAQP